MYPEEIEAVQAAARKKEITMSDFIREASVREAKRVNRDKSKAAQTAA